MDTTNLPALEPTTTVNDVLRLVPEAPGLLLERGVDTCCGGSATLAEACDDAELDLGALLAARRRATGASWCSASSRPDPPQRDRGQPRGDRGGAGGVHGRVHAGSGDGRRLAHARMAAGA